MPAAGYSVEFFDAQFTRQIAQHEFALNPFEAAVLPHLRGSVLDFGCGLGNLALAAARRGHAVLALDASPAAVAHLGSIAAAERLSLEARQADLRAMRLDRVFDSVVCIGLLMFFDCAAARTQLDHLRSRVAPGGIAALNVLTEGTTFMGMFGPEGHCLFPRDALAARFADWTILYDDHSEHPAPGGMVKAFATLIAERPR